MLQQRSLMGDDMADRSLDTAFIVKPHESGGSQGSPLVIRRVVPSLN